MKVKILEVGNFSSLYVVVKEDGDLWHVIDELGDLEQVNKNRIEIDSLKECDFQHFHRSFNGQGSKRPRKLSDGLLRYVVEHKTKEIETILKGDFSHHNQAQTCLEDNKNKVKLLALYSSFCPKDELCEIEVHEHHMNFLDGADKQIVMLVMEEFGVFYINGKKLRRYLLDYGTKKNVKGKKYWSLKVDHSKILSVDNASAFPEVSDNPNFVKSFSLPHGDSSNVFSLSDIREAQEVMDKIKKSKKGIKIFPKSVKKGR